MLVILKLEENFHAMCRSVQFCTVLFCLCLSACSSTKEEQWQTRGELVERTVGDKMEFAYAMTWFPAAKDNSSSILSAFGLKPRKRSAQSLYVDNAGKLAMEDKAAVQLEAELRKRNLCKNGYDIQQTIWKDRSVRLIGVCQ